MSLNPVIAQANRAASKAAKTLLGLVPSESRDYAQALLEEVVTHRFVAATEAAREHRERGVA